MTNATSHWSILIKFLPRASYFNKIIWNFLVTLFQILDLLMQLSNSYSITSHESVFEIIPHSNYIINEHYTLSNWWYDGIDYPCMHQVVTPFPCRVIQIVFIKNLNLSIQELEFFLHRQSYFHLHWSTMVIITR